MNTIDFHKTTTKELLALKDRVRFLIDHWGEDGRYKEAVLKSVIKRFIPEKFCISTGFVIKQTGIRGEHEASRQIDIIIYNTEYPVLFKEGDVSIVTADSVEAIIEVKANLRNQGLEKVVRKANEIGQFIFNAKANKDKTLFNAIFSFSGYERLRINDCRAVQTAINNAENTTSTDTNINKFKVNHISINKDNFYKFWNRNEPEDGKYLYKIEELSFSFLISNLIAHLKSDSVYSNHRLWFPVDKNEISQRF